MTTEGPAAVTSQQTRSMPTTLQQAAPGPDGQGQATGAGLIRDGDDHARGLMLQSRPWVGGRQQARPPLREVRTEARNGHEEKKSSEAGQSVRGQANPCEAELGQIAFQAASRDGLLQPEEEEVLAPHGDEACHEQASVDQQQEGPARVEELVVREQAGRFQGCQREVTKRGAQLVNATVHKDRGLEIDSPSQPGDHTKAHQRDTDCKQVDAQELTELQEEAAQAVLEGLVSEQEDAPEPDEQQGIHEEGGALFLHQADLTLQPGAAANAGAGSPALAGSGCQGGHAYDAMLKNR
eukprot:CAMPEP_0204178868 /NCGR_PEP_ID=MMETSP0361-20130328/49679_1 /ASSEMBLY_ACC=CAM_ASM_000343 /TAXON_ID=268821 /ORGANISM="Scrippsiella Hangoei, Strain SHTV-5" /LENGTH=294 /DNA_ID=CAMNT_0051138045 /DNA_START=236 /DNA_END=1118 /DNA_ORIENTATION=-